MEMEMEMEMEMWERKKPQKVTESNRKTTKRPQKKPSYNINK